MPRESRETKNIRFIQGAIGGSVVVIKSTDDILNIDTGLGSVSLYLPNIKDANIVERKININDVGNNAAVNNITIFGTGTDLVNSAASLVLSTNGSSVNCQPANQVEWLVDGYGASSSGGTTISGLTENYLSKSNATGDNIVNSQVFDNGTNVGVGTNTPIAKCDISGTLRVNDGTQGLGKGLISNALGVASWGSILTPTTGWAINGNTVVDDTKWIGTIDNFDWSVKTNSLERLRVLKNGDVGIGTASPTALLDIYKSNPTAGASNTLLKLNFLDFGNAVGDKIKVDFGGALGFNAIVTSGNYNFSWDIQATEILKLTKLSNSAYFHRDTNITAGTLNDVIQFSYNQFGLVVGDEMGVVMSNDNTTNVFTRISSKVTSTGNVGLNFYTYNNALSNNMTLDSVGNLGIGTLSPTSRLHAKGTTSDTSAYASKIDNVLNNPLLYVRNDGYVGIGVISPGSRLHVYNVGTIAQLKLDDGTYVVNFHVNGTSSLTEINTGNIGFQLGTTDGYYRLNRYGSSGSALIYTNGLANSLQLSGNTSGANFVTIKPTGTVNMSSSQVGNAGLSSGDTYFDTAANILANGDLVMGRKV